VRIIPANTSPEINAGIPNRFSQWLAILSYSPVVSIGPLVFVVHSTLFPFLTSEMHDQSTAIASKVLQLQVYSRR